MLAISKLACRSVKYPAQIIFFLILLAVELGVYRDYGISWDELTSRTNGAVTLKHVVERFAPSLLTDAASGLDPLNKYIDRDYGVAFEAPAVALEVILGIHDKKMCLCFDTCLRFWWLSQGCTPSKEWLPGDSHGGLGCSRHFFWF